MYKVKLVYVLVFSSILFTGCAINDFSNMSGIQQMGAVMKGAQEVKQNIDTYDNAKRVVKTANTVHDLVTTPETEPDKSEVIIKSNDVAQ